MCREKSPDKLQIVAPKYSAGKAVVEKLNTVAVFPKSLLAIIEKLVDLTPGIPSQSDELRFSVHLLKENKKAMVTA